MSEGLLLDKLESADWVAESLEKVEAALRDIARVVGPTAEKMKGTTLAFENAWRKIVTNVAQGQTAEMQAARPGLLNDFERRLGLLKQAHALLTRFQNQGWTDFPDPDYLLSEIAGLERLKARVFDPWQSTEDLEDLAASDYPLNTADLYQIGPQRRPPASWYTEEGKPF
jgi:hypothetical protein